MTGAALGVAQPVRPFAHRPQPMRGEGPEGLRPVRARVMHRVESAATEAPMQTEPRTPEKTPSPDKLQARLDELKTLRDEIRVRLHLGGLDVKDAFKKIEPSVDKVELEVKHAAKDAAVAVDKTLDKLAKTLQSLRKKLPK